MPTREWIEDLPAALAARQEPTVMSWNRLEGTPRAVGFERALKAEVRDALWMLSRQWQLGELLGDDAGSPCEARLRVQTTRLERCQLGSGAPVPFDRALPLEAAVERLPLPLARHDQAHALDLRLAMGRYWLKLVSGIGDYADAYLTLYGVTAPDAADPGEAERLAHADVLQAFAAAAGRLVDGAKLYEHLTGSGAGKASDGIALSDPAHGPLLDQGGNRFVAWFKRLVLQPEGEAASAWIPERLEYRFGCAAATEGGENLRYLADEYFRGRLDWYALDLDPARPDGADEDRLPEPSAETHALLPVPIKYDGMPSTRWWEIEDRRTNFGAVDATTTDLAKLLFLEFSLVYANDWFVIPCSLEAGTIAAVQGLTVTNVFGERFWIDAAGKGPDDGWQRWRMFGTSTRGRRGEPADTRVMLLPTVPKVQESDPLEEVLLLRDEVANMVWGVEELVPLASGATKRGAEAARELRGHLERRLAAKLEGQPSPDRDFAADVYYRVMNSVPEHWIPFIPVRVAGASRRIQLQRAALPRVLDRDPEDPVKVEPRTTLLRHGLDQPDPAIYLVHDEEVPRSGVRVRLSFKRTRWRDGRAVLWLGARKAVGRGEGSSGLAFDQLTNAPRERVRAT